MEMQRVWAVYFSGTGTTEKVVTRMAKIAAEDLGAEYKTFCFNLPKDREGELSFGPGDLVIFGTPVYAGRVPNLLLPYIRDKVKGNGALAVPVVLYGNRNFDDGLMELRNVLRDNGFHPIAAGAFVGALVSILLVYGLSRSGGAVTPVRLILVGVAVSAMFQAFTNYLVYTAPDDAAVREATFWMLGGLGSAKWEDLPLLALILPPLFLVLMALARPLNAMLMGDSSAVTLGVDLDRVRGVLILSSALLTASAVAVSGCIGFVGLVIPHLVRSVVGADHRRLIPLSALCGAVFMIWMDVGARLAVRPEEIPVGIITAFIGAPLFLWMIRVRRYEF